MSGDLSLEVGTFRTYSSVTVLSRGVRRPVEGYNPSCLIYLILCSRLGLSERVSEVKIH